MIKSLERVMKSFPKPERKAAVAAFQRAAEYANLVAPDGWSVREYQSEELRLHVRTKVVLALYSPGGSGHIWVALDEPTIAEVPGLADAIREEPHWEVDGRQYTNYRRGCRGLKLYLGDDGDTLLEQAWPAVEAFILHQAEYVEQVYPHDAVALATLTRHGARLPERG